MKTKHFFYHNVYFFALQQIWEEGISANLQNNVTMQKKPR